MEALDFRSLLLISKSLLRATILPIAEPRLLHLIWGVVASMKDWRAKRNMAGFFDGGPTRILPSNGNSSAQENHEKVGMVHF
jgi:hypothetical protein